jgi:hypothetical protein
LATPGSPISRTLMLPLIFIPSTISLVTPPTINNNNAFLTSSIEKISGQIECASLSYKTRSDSHVLLKLSTFSSASSVRKLSLKFYLSFDTLNASRKVSWVSPALIA